MRRRCSGVRVSILAYFYRTRRLRVVAAEPVAGALAGARKDGEVVRGRGYAFAVPNSAPPDGAVLAADARRPVAVDLFAGAGGLSLGLEQAGFDVVAAVEYDPVHAAAHKFNFPKTAVLCADVSDLDTKTLRGAVEKGLSSHGHDLEQWDGEVDIVVGGPPCQGFSLIGKRLVDDIRNRLVFHFVRLVLAMRPRYFVMENVPGMITGGHASILDELIGEFERAGYRFPSEEKYRVLNAADFGVPQERHRLFLIGTRKDREVLAEAPAPTARPVPKRPGVDSLDVEANEERPDLPCGPTAWEAIGDLPNVNVFATLLCSDETKLSAERLAAMEATASSYARRLRGMESDPGDLSYLRIWDRALLTASMRTEHTEDSVRRFRRTVCGETESISRFYKLHPDGLCNTLRAGSGSERGAFTSPRPLHPHYPRVLSNREAARLHSFPDWFRPHATKWHGFRQIGNSVPPLLGRAVGRQIVKALGVSPERPIESTELGSLQLLALTMSQAADRLGADRASIPAQRTRPVASKKTRSPEEEDSEAEGTRDRRAAALV
jgi:DNA (cytosine-5)-methyltransferase 1